MATKNKRFKPDKRKDYRQPSPDERDTGRGESEGGRFEENWI